MQLSCQACLCICNVFGCVSLSGCLYGCTNRCMPVVCVCVFASVCLQPPHGAQVALDYGKFTSVPSQFAHPMSLLFSNMHLSKVTGKDNCVCRCVCEPLSMCL